MANFSIKAQKSSHIWTAIKSKYCKKFCNNVTMQFYNQKQYFIRSDSLLSNSPPSLFLLILVFLYFLSISLFSVCWRSGFYYHGWWISRSTIARLMVVFLWVFLGGCWPVLWWVCLVVAGFFWRCGWVFLIGADGFGSVMGLINVMVVDGLMGLGSVMGWWLFMLVVVVVAGDDLGFCFYLDFGIYYFIM